MRRPTALRLQHGSAGGHDWKGPVMRQPAMLIGIAAASLILGVAPAAQAANTNNEHFAITESFTEFDFCGTGQAVEVTVTARATSFPAPNEPNVDFAQNSRVTVTWFNPETGATVIGHVANRFLVGTVSGDPEGIHIDEVTWHGLDQIRLDNGRALITNAGNITVTETWNGDELLTSEITVNNGPHPTFEDEQLFCEVVTAALGL